MFSAQSRVIDKIPSVAKLIRKIMENHSSGNCCFCDKDLSPSDQSSTKSSVIKYKCPACERIYCSANCFGGHKEKYDCSGVRNKIPYVNLSQFDQKQFLDDYFFLEEVNKKIESAHRALPTLKKGVTSDVKSNSKRRYWARKRQSKAQRTSNDNNQ